MGRACLVSRAVLFVVALFAALLSCSKDAPLGPTGSKPPNESELLLPGLSVGPVRGLTTTWHLAPAKFAVTNDTGRLQFRFVSLTEAIIVWKGAVEVSRHGNVSVAECEAPPAGTSHSVEVNVLPRARGDEVSGSRYSTAFRVLDIPPSAVTIDDVVVTETGPDLDQLATPAARMRFILGGYSLAAVTDLGESAYRTAVGAAVQVKAVAGGADVAPLLEWRVNGVGSLLGVEGRLTMPPDPGDITISVGPPGHARVIHIATYSASIAIDGGRILVGEPTTFRVTTNPAGYENEIRWISGTLYGTAEPAYGTGATFSAVFDRPWPTEPEGVICMGVGAAATSAFVDNPPQFGDDMTRLDTAVGDLAKELGEHACCITDSTAQAELYKAINTLIKTRDALQQAISAYSALSAPYRLAINLAYKDSAAEMRTKLVELEQQITAFNNLPDCTAQALQAAYTDGIHQLDFFEDLCNFLIGFGTALTAMGLVITAIGVAVTLIALPFGAAPVGAPIVLAGVLFGAAGLSLITVAYLIGC